MGCSVNPVTGKRQFNIVSTKEEVKIGKQADPFIRRQYGVYPNERLQNYVNTVGQRVAKVSKREGITYSFTVLDASLINAFALPGGYLYVTRGALAQMNSEAELAFVLGHEISHVAAKHGAQRLSQQRSIGIANILAQVLTQKEDLGLAGRVVNTGINFAVLGYGRENEFESDLIGLRYAYDAKYNTEKRSSFFKYLKATI